MIKVAEGLSRSSAPSAPSAFARSKCGTCTALCCNYFALEIDAPEEPADFENLRWYVLHEDTWVFVEGEAWYLQVFRKCVWLVDNRCSRYDDRPQICREYSNDHCDKDGGESDHVFRTIEELDAFRARWVADYEAKQERARKRKAAKRARLARERRAAMKASKAVGSRASRG